MNFKKHETKIWIAVVVIVVAIFIGWRLYEKNQPGTLDGFTQCLQEQGAVFYGAFWCPHCQNQKKAFGNSAGKLPYVECSLPGGNGQTQECNDKQIESYPTWIFGDGTRETGELSLARLAEKAGCELPQ